MELIVPVSRAAIRREQVSESLLSYLHSIDRHAPRTHVRNRVSVSVSRLPKRDEIERFRYRALFGDYELGPRAILERHAFEDVLITDEMETQ